MWFIILCLIVLIIYVVYRASAKAAGMVLSNKFYSLGDMTGKTRQQIIAVVGYPTVSGPIFNGKQLLTWKAVGYCIDIQFGADGMFAGIVQENGVNRLLQPIPQQVSSAPVRVYGKQESYSSEHASYSDGEENWDDGDDGGIVAHLGLTSWWLSTFTTKQRRWIADEFNEDFGKEVWDTSGLVISDVSDSAAVFLCSLADHFTSRDTRLIARKLLYKAEEDALSRGDFAELHEVYGALIHVCYLDRENWDGALEKVIGFCNRQIGIAPQAKLALLKRDGKIPEPHRGYDCLTEILEEQKRYSEALHLCEQAIQQEWGWGLKARSTRCAKMLKSKGM